MTGAGAMVRSLKVLVVDDEPLLAMSIADMLEDLGHTAIQALSAEQALAIAAADPTIDLVVTDQMMPGMRGTDLARRLAELRRDLQVFLSTGYDDTRGADNSLPQLHKPYTMEDLEALIAARFGIS
jgi:CheY-like chemotaxis protein